MTDIRFATDRPSEAELSQIGDLRRRIDHAFATQLSPVALRNFCKKFIGNKWRKQIWADLDKFAREKPSEMLDLALLSVQEEEAELIGADRDKLELLDIRLRGNSDGTTTMFLKREAPKLKESD